MPRRHIANQRAATLRQQLAQEFKRTERTTTASKYDFIESVIGKRKRMNYMSEEELVACVREIGKERGRAE